MLIRRIGLLVALGTLWACEGAPHSEAAREATDDLKMIPASANLVAYCDLAKLKNTPLGEEIVRNINRDIEKDADPEEREFTRAILEAIDAKNVLLGLNTREEDEEDQGYIVLHGDFDAEKFIELVEEKRAQEHEAPLWRMEKVGGKRAYFFRRKPESGLVFLNKNTCVIGPRSWLVEIIDKKQVDNHVKKNQRLTGLIEKAKYGDQFWLVVDEPMQGRNRKWRVNLKGEMGRVQKSVQNLVISARLSEDLNFESAIECSNAEDSQLMTDLLRGGLAALKLAMYSDRTAVDELNEIRIYQRGKEVIANGRLSKTFWKMLRESSDDWQGI